MRHFCHSQHFEITGHTKPTFPKQRSCRNAKVVLASTLVTGRNSSELKVSLAARQCQRLRSTKVSIRSRSSACSRLVSTERPHRNLTVTRPRVIPFRGSLTGDAVSVRPPSLREIPVGGFVRQATGRVSGIERRELCERRAAGHSGAPVHSTVTGPGAVEHVRHLTKRGRSHEARGSLHQFIWTMKVPQPPPP